MKTNAYLFITILIVILLSCDKNTNQDEKIIEPYSMVEEMPVFPGGNEALLKYVAEKAKYPESAKKQGIQGKVIIQFVVESNGSVSRATVLKGADPSLDTEALRVVNSITGFMPGREKGVNVPVLFMIPITFSLK